MDNFDSKDQKPKTVSGLGPKGGIPDGLDPAFDPSSASSHMMTVKKSNAEPQFVADGDAGYDSPERKYIMMPRVPNDRNPKVWDVLMKNTREMLRKKAMSSDGKELPKTNLERYNILFGQDSDLLARAGYPSVTDVVPLLGDDEAMTAAKTTTLYTAKVDMWTTDVLWVLFNHFVIDAMKGTGMSKIATAYATVNNQRVLFSNFHGMPINSQTYKNFMKEAQVAMRYSSGAEGDGRLGYYIPWVIYGVSDVSQGNVTGHPHFTADGQYDPAYYDGMLKPGWASNLIFYPTKIGSPDAYDYGFITSRGNMARALRGQGSVLTGNDGIKSTEYCQNFSDVSRLPWSMMKHEEWLLAKLRRAFGTINGFATEEQVREACIALGDTENHKWSKKIDAELSEMLFAPSDSFFDATLDINGFQSEISAMLENPVDAEVILRERNTISPDVEPIRQWITFGPKGQSNHSDRKVTIARSAEVLVPNDFAIPPSKRTKLVYNDSRDITLSYFKSLAVEIINNYTKVFTQTPNDLSVDGEVYPSAHNVKNLHWRPDLSIFIPSGLDTVPSGDAKQQPVIVGMYPVVPWINHDSRTYHNRYDYNLASGELLPNALALTKVNAYDCIKDVLRTWDYKQALKRSPTDSPYVFQNRPTTMGELAGIQHWVCANKDHEPQRVVGEQMPLGQFEMLKLLNSMDEVRIYSDKAEASNRLLLGSHHTYIDGKFVMNTFFDNTTVKGFSQSESANNKLYHYTDDGDGSTAASKTQAKIGYYDYNNRLDLTKNTNEVKLYIKNSIKPWTVESTFISSGINYDPDYAIDYEIKSSQNTGHYAIGGIDEANYGDGKALIARVHFRETSFMDELVDQININSEVGKAINGERLKDNASWSDVLPLMMQCCRRGIYIDHATKAALDMLANDLDDAKYNDRSLAHLNGYYDSILNAENYEISSNGGKYNNLWAISPRFTSSRNTNFSEFSKWIMMDSFIWYGDLEHLVENIDVYQNNFRLWLMYTVINRGFALYQRQFGQINRYKSVNMDAWLVKGGIAMYEYFYPVKWEAFDSDLDAPKVPSDWVKAANTDFVVWTNLVRKGKGLTPLRIPKRKDPDGSNGGSNETNQSNNKNKVENNARGKAGRNKPNSTKSGEENKTKQRIQQELSKQLKETGKHVAKEVFNSMVEKALGYGSTQLPEIIKTIMMADTVENNQVEDKTGGSKKQLPDNTNQTGA